MLNLYQNLHSEVYNAIKASADVSSITDNVYDGMPIQLLRGKGYPMIIVDSPLGSETPMTVGSNPIYDGIITVSIMVVSTKQSLARQIADAVRKAVATSSYSTAEFVGIRNSREQLNIRRVEGSKKEVKEWVIILDAGFRVSGSW